MPIKEKSAGIVIFRCERVLKFLVLHYQAGHWDFPHGHIEPGESEEETAIRETKEETGISEINLLPEFREKINFFYTRDKQLINKDVIYFLAETSKSEIKLTEHPAYKWLNFEDAYNLVTFKNSKQVLKKANEFIRLQDSLKKLIKE